jgi:diguanylate cyclase (GGDEF)-like protein
MEPHRLLAVFSQENIKVYLLLLSSFVLIAFFVSVDKAIFSKQTTRASLDVAVGKSREREQVFGEFFLRAGNAVAAVRESDLFVRFLESGNAELVQPLFMAIARSDAMIMQVRFIDQAGMERVRVDRDRQGAAPFVIPQGRLQDKSGRSYFVSDNNRRLGETWFSGIDLNVEGGRVEVPFKPTLRAVRPVSNDRGFGGIIVINYFMQEFLERFIKTGIFDVYLVDGQLNTLVHPEAGKSWSAYRERPYDIATEFPGLVQALRDDDYENGRIYVKRLDLPVDRLYAVFVVKQEYIRNRQAIDNERILILVVSSLLLSGLLSVFLTRIVHGFVSNIRERKKLYALLQQRADELERVSVTDALTKVFNRRYFDEQVTQAINAAKREDKLLNLAMFDIDYFKRYNDRYGHQAGDRVLEAIGKLLNEQLRRAGDCAFRLGGEEFAILINSKTRAEAIQFVDRIRQAIEALGIEHAQNDVSAFVTASFGLVSMPANEVESRDSLYRMADRLLYRAKDVGRNRVEVNQPRTLALDSC